MNLRRLETNGDYIRVLGINDEYLDTNELAELTKTKPQTWRKKRWRGDSPPFVKLGNRVLYRRSDVEQYLAERTFNNTSEATFRGRQ
jgi:predicted DNA-binding transcriptional regulator AlpA